MAVKVRKKKTTSVVVIWSVFAVMLLGITVLGADLWNLQVRQKSGFDEVFRSQSVRRVRLPAVRGRIYDANGVCMADSVPNYCIAIYTSELRAPRSVVANTLELVHEIATAIDREPDITYQDICAHIEFSSNFPLTAWKKISAEEKQAMLKFVEDKTAPGKGELLRKSLPGIDVDHPVKGDSIAILTAELKRRPTTTAANTLELVYEISERIGIPREISMQDIKNHIFQRRPLPLMAWENISDETMAKWADTCSDLTGTDIYYQPARHYDETVATTLGHLLGFTMEADVEQSDDEPFDFDIPGIEGKKGLEDKYNNLLKGESGYKLVQIDVSGYHHQDLEFDPPQPGGDLQLTIDAHIQKFAWDALTMRLDSKADPFEGPVRGAVVVLDPNNGDVLAMTSSPGFDPNRYIESNAYRQLLMADETAPTFNRAVYGRYAPGSTFKPIAALGVLREHPEYASVTYDCPGYHMVGGRRMNCNARYGHGSDLTIRQALEKSCNVYMYQMALDVGYEPMYRMARDFGIGQVTGLFPDLNNLDGGIIANGAKYGNLPETAVGKVGACNLSIGQGDLVVAPLQMAMVASAIANGGSLYRPRLIHRYRFGPDLPYQTIQTQRIRKIDIPADALAIVRGGMYDVVMGGEESAKVVQVGDIKIAGKTGTAQYGPEQQNTWMISYAPFDNPRYAIAFIVEDGEYGGTTVAPRLHELYEDIFEYDGTIASGGAE
ncbi:MAG: hypothetical protein JXR23_02240 [Pontiellaceae bacterium]|nr:hypothetical protein [Pontiellaceae bacterium]